MKGHGSLRTANNAGRQRCARWMPCLVLIILLFVIFQLDLRLHGISRGLRAPKNLDDNFEDAGVSGLFPIVESDVKPTCERWLEEKDKVKYSRNFSQDPILVALGESAEWKTCAIGCEFLRSVAPNKKIDAVFGIRGEPGIASVMRSMESAQYYPDNNVATAKQKGYTVVMTTSLSSDVPVGYFSWAEYSLMDPPKNKTQKALAAAFITNCGGHNFRLEALTKLKEHGISVDSYGACLRNQDGHVNKLETLRDYKFSLAFENSNEDDYVTEKFWQSLVAGSVPVVIGAPNIHDFEPSNNSILHIKSLNDIAGVAKQMKYLAKHDEAYNDMLSWKFEGPSDAFKALVDMAVVHSSCRLCLHLGTKLRLEEERNYGLQNRPCQCQQDLDTIYHVYVRERGKFESESIFLRSSNMTLDALYHAIVSKFESLNYVPIFKSGRPKVIEGDNVLRVYRVYPIGMTQRQALYTWKFQDLQTYVKENPCANLEVIFV